MQVIEQAHQWLIKEQGQVVLDAGAEDPVGRISIEAAAGGIPLKGLTPSGAQAHGRSLVSGVFAARQQSNLLNGMNGALAVRVEDPNGVDLVIEQLDAVGQAAAHGVEVHQTATQGVLAG